MIFHWVKRVSSTIFPLYAIPCFPMNKNMSITCWTTNLRVRTSRSRLMITIDKRWYITTLLTSKSYFRCKIMISRLFMSVNCFVYVFGINVMSSDKKIFSVVFTSKSTTATAKHLVKVDWIGWPFPKNFISIRQESVIQFWGFKWQFYSLSFGYLNWVIFRESLFYVDLIIFIWTWEWTYGYTSSWVLVLASNSWNFWDFLHPHIPCQLVLVPDDNLYKTRDDAFDGWLKEAWLWFGFWIRSETLLSFFPDPIRFGFIFWN